MSLYFRDTAMTGRVTNLITTRQGLMMRVTTVISVSNEEGERETYKVPGKIPLEVGATVHVDGGRMVTDSLSIDFLGGATERVWEARLKKLKNLLQGNLPAEVAQISAGGQAVFRDEQRELVFAAMRKRPSGEKWWDKVEQELREKEQRTNA